MKIGLVRHYKVTYAPENKWMNATQFNYWVDEYNKSSIQPNDQFDRSTKWDVCFSSDLSRAVQTAERLYKGHIVKTNLLREIDVRSAIQLRFKLHFKLWLVIGRVAWYFSHQSQEESRSESMTRVRQIVDRIETSEETNILVVSHGALMRFISKELIRRGYMGKELLKPENGVLYMFEK
ncbi:histidine phosphatase family protein [Paenibacillus profundus]|uniref:Histidine phosphatase family protein n=1 Tax=Paenibacillus profundus TaxID=1173085 RepID=A0ABS8YR17_9BACL|nr:histidine phosphatase family protein [Paenibacillus profundus]MCE5173065.1 histidine phosphatase family protein [Paenibacillus profundus]